MIVRVGQDHWRAKLTDHEVDLIRMVLRDRRALVTKLRSAGVTTDFGRALGEAGLSFRRIGLKFDVSESLIRAIDSDRVRLWSGRTSPIARKAELPT